MQNNTLDNIASRIINRKHDIQGLPQEVFVDPATILIVAQIITEIIKLFKGCQKTPEEAMEVAFKPKGAVERRSLKRAIRKKIGWWNFVERKYLYAAIVSEGYRVTTEDMTCLYQETPDQ